jgi:4-alpha-glucanotransferase
VHILGDLPFYMDRDSVEVWSSAHLFQLDEHGSPEMVAGCPPDYFTADGQWWGNPVYAWDAHAHDGFAWWLTRIGTQARRFDGLRLDHFRALEAFWAIPATADTAREGHWEPSPGATLLEAIRASYPELAIVAEDLGVITEPVRALRDGFDLPGMRILQFAFDGSADNPYLPGNHTEHSVVYTGTHDNDTTVGWFESLDDKTREYVREVIGPGPMPDVLINRAYESVANTAIVPMQDLLALDGSARMNTPGTTGHNWEWRFSWEQVPTDFAPRYRRLAAATRRV